MRTAINEEDKNGERNAYSQPSTESVFSCTKSLCVPMDSRTHLFLVLKRFLFFIVNFVAVGVGARGAPWKLSTRVFYFIFEFVHRRQCKCWLLFCALFWCNAGVPCKWFPIWPPVVFLSVERWVCTTEIVFFLQVWPLLSFCYLRLVVFFLFVLRQQYLSFFLFSSVQGTKELLFLRQLWWKCRSVKQHIFVAEASAFSAKVVVFVFQTFVVWKLQLSCRGYSFSANMEMRIDMETCMS